MTTNERDGEDTRPGGEVARPDGEEARRGGEDDRNLSQLAAAGFPVADFTRQQRAVFSRLTPEELAVVLDIRARLDEVEPEVRAHTAVAGAALF